VSSTSVTQLSIFQVPNVNKEVEEVKKQEKSTAVQNQSDVKSYTCFIKRNVLGGNHPMVKTMQTRISSVGSPSDGNSASWCHFAFYRPPAPLHLQVLLQKTPAPSPPRHEADEPVNPPPHPLLTQAATPPVTTPSEIIPYYRLTHFIWPLSDNKESSR
jgi:hypothetical protein